ncbi:MAG: SDR family NAD(P)-dependent oxidoreductase [Rhodocyclaceae bacterium]|jgi:3-oxoacyl-[acyl-carrier protein] reductase|nr:SDR family NAD(P)-dependent oxidoreductase [Rhodocyclaceae bacterium]
MRKLEGKVAVITGAGRGIGRAVALKLAQDGACIVVNDLDAAPAEEVVKEVEALGSKAIAFAGSVTAPDFASKLVAATLESFGTIDMVINNAGYTWDGSAQKMTDEQWQAMLDVHTTAPFRILRAAFEPMRLAAKQEADEGREVFRKVVNVASLTGVIGSAFQCNYSAAKAGVIGLTKALAKEWGRYKINVNCVAFGLVETRLTAVREGDKADTINIEGRELNVGIAKATHDRLPQIIPLGRGATVEEAAGAIYLMCLPEANYVTGQVLCCDGGR